MSAFLVNNRSIASLVILSIVGLPTASFSQTVGVHTIMAVTGKVTVIKKQWKKPQPASIALTLSAEDKLDVALTATVTVYCSNLAKYTFKPGKHNVSSGCPAGKSVLRLTNSNNDTLRADGKTEAALAKLPYLITPRETKVLSNRPQLRWNPVPGAGNYTVKIDGVNWQTQTNRTTLIYPGELPLEPGKRYRIVVETDNGQSSESDAKVGFIIVDANTQKTVLDAVKTIEQQQLSIAERGTILAQLYRGYELYADAIDVLERSAKQGDRSISTEQLLGDTYLLVGLPQLAKKPYERAIKLATGTDNLPLQAEIQAGLGKTHSALGNEKEALQWLQKAKVVYQQLGDSSQVRELDKQINSISGR